MQVYKTIDEYIDAAEPAVREKLREMRSLLQCVAPLSTEAIKYGLPTLMIDGKNYLHYGVSRDHIGFYPTPGPIQAFARELSPYVTSKGAIQLPLDAPLPTELITRIALSRLMTGFPGYPLISRAEDGNMQLKDPASQDSRQKFAERVGIPYNKIVAGQLVNDTTVALVGAQDAGHSILATDGLITTDPDIWLSITVADCLPVVIYKPGAVVALLHCGWRGLAGEIISRAIVMIAQETGILPSDLSAWIGPGIEMKDYEVGAEVASQFARYPRAVMLIDGKTHLDLRAIAFAQLKIAGIKKSAIHSLDVCTYCRADLYSARRDKTNPVQAMMVLTHV